MWLNVQFYLAQQSVADECVMRRDAQLEDSQGADACPDAGTISEYDVEYCAKAACVDPNIGVSGSLCCLFSTIYFITDWIFTLLMVIVILFVFWGAFDILQAAGEAERINKGRDRIMYAAVGLGIALLAKMIPALVKYIMT